MYHYVIKRLDTQALRTGYDPFLLQARTLRTVEKRGQNVLIAEEAQVTTDDYQNPSFWLKDRDLQVENMIYPDIIRVRSDPNKPFTFYSVLPRSENMLYENAEFFLARLGQEL